MHIIRARRLATATALTAALAVGTIAGPTASATATQGGAAQAPATAPEIGVTRQATMNIRFSMGPRRQRRDIRRTAAQADVVGWQEINRDAQTGAIDALAGFETYWPGGRRPDGAVWRYPTNTNPISWRTDTWAFVRGGAWLASREIKDVVRDRYLTFVVLRHRASGERIVRWNIHFVPNARNASRVRKKAARRRAWHRQARTVRKFLDHYTGRPHAAVLGGGDINWRARFAGDRVSYDTEHQRIDYLTHLWSPRVRASAPVFTGMHSDHDLVRVDYTLTR